MLETATLPLLQKGKNLLAFSGGSDSTALFFLLLEQKISFDITIVDYGVREQSKEEVAYAKKLAKQYNLLCHETKAPAFQSNFEAKAREFRYSFFEELIAKYGYTNLLTAHHLNDKLEWFLMQLCKGSGLIEALGMEVVEQRENYQLLRPLLFTPKKQILDYLEQHNIHFFHDSSNDDTTIKRNYFRKKFANKLLEECQSGIAKSFSYLHEDKELLLQTVELHTIKEFAYFKKNNPRSNLVAIDRYLKSKKHLLTQAEKEELKKEQTLVVGRKFVVAFHEKFVFIAPFIKLKKPMPKLFKEECRKLRIEPKLRPYLFKNQHIFNTIKTQVLKA